ncbi:MAG: septum site-determining protein MinC [Chloroflexi bacterium]|nr:septum site-determining protein MinC [Chloroflexota bacterium]
MKDKVRIKGIREGLLVSFDTLSFDEMLSSLRYELPIKQSFLQGSRVAVQLGKRPFRKHQLLELQRLFAEYNLELWAVLSDEPQTRAIARELNLATRLAGSSTDLEGNQLDVSVTESAVAKVEPPQNLILKETIRSGRKIYAEGAVVIIGDVNPGAEIIAGGDVIVWGRLRGMVHAGALGDETAVICAISLNPTQLRIADQITISPDYQHRTPVPEQAAIRQGQIVAEPWQK